MNAQVERLEGLLARVQSNRSKPRVGLAPVAAAAPAPTAAPRVEPARSARRRQSTPLEMALEEQLSKPAVAPAPVTARQPAPPPRPAAAAPPVVAPPVVAPPKPPPSIRPAVAGPDHVEEVPVVQPSRPIVHVISSHPPIQGETFGEILRRTLALRPG